LPDIHVRQHKDILWLILDRQPLNTLTIGMLDRLANALRSAALHPPRIVVITGMGEQAFCAGVDLPDKSDAGRARLLLIGREVEAALVTLHAQQILVVALIKGRVSDAGCELAALCDVVIAREDATFLLSTKHSRVFSQSLALSFDKTFSAREALHDGFVHQVISTSRFLADTEELLLMLASGSFF
jgi:enoyl-CoA hydratase/carnithine racemase